MKLLLDTHVDALVAARDRRLGREARRAIADGRRRVGQRRCRLGSGHQAVARGGCASIESFRVTVAADDFTELPLTLRHAEELERLPAHHGDPFDRLLIAQARAEGATIVTHDRAFEPYGVPIIWT